MLVQSGLVPAGLITNLVASGVIDPTQPFDINTLALLTTMATQNPEFNTVLPPNAFPYPIPPSMENPMMSNITYHFEVLSM